MIRYVKQPDGKIAIWTTIADGFLVEDLTIEEAIRYMVERQLRRIWDDIKDFTDIITSWYNGDPKQQVWDMTWEECQELIKYQETGELEDEEAI